MSGMWHTGKYCLATDSFPGSGVACFDPSDGRVMHAKTEAELQCQYQSAKDFDQDFAPMFDANRRMYSCFARLPAGRAELLEAPTVQELRARIDREGLEPCRLKESHG